MLWLPSIHKKGAKQFSEELWVVKGWLRLKQIKISEGVTVPVETYFLKSPSLTFEHLASKILACVGACGPSLVAYGPILGAYVPNFGPMALISWPTAPRGRTHKQTETL